jgi:hypothetical protein
MVVEINWGKNFGKKIIFLFMLFFLLNFVSSVSFNLSNYSKVSINYNSSIPQLDFFGQLFANFFSATNMNCLNNFDCLSNQICSNFICHSLNWYCSDWTDCNSFGIQTRDCYEKNNLSDGKPIEKRTCFFSPQLEIGGLENKTYYPIAPKPIINGSLLLDQNSNFNYSEEFFKFYINAPSVKVSGEYYREPTQKTPMGGPCSRCISWICSNLDKTNCTCSGWENYHC